MIINLPDSWSTGKRKAASQVEHTSTGKQESKKKQKSQPTQQELHEFNIHDVYNTIKKCIEVESEPQRQDLEIQIDTIMSRLPYRRMMQDLFQNTENSGDKTTSIVPVSKVYEELFLREPTKQYERPCVMGVNCECRYIDPNIPFTAVEFLLPGEDPPEEVQMCVICNRKNVKRLYYDMMFMGKTFRGHIQRYGNIIDEPGEYAKESCLMCPPNGPVFCMPLPVVDHARNRLSVGIVNGVKTIKQHRMSYEHFQGPPSEK